MVVKQIFCACNEGVLTVIRSVMMPDVGVEFVIRLDAVHGRAVELVSSSRLSVELVVRFDTVSWEVGAVESKALRDAWAGTSVARWQTSMTWHRGDCFIGAGVAETAISMAATTGIVDPTCSVAAASSRVTACSGSACEGQAWQNRTLHR